MALRHRSGRALQEYMALAKKPPCELTPEDIDRLAELEEEFDQEDYETSYYG